MPSVSLVLSMFLLLELGIVGLSLTVIYSKIIGVIVK